MPEHGVGVFALANRTYAGPSTAVWDAAAALRWRAFSRIVRRHQRGSGERLSRRGDYLPAGDVAAGGDVLAMNFLMDRDADKWRREIAGLKKESGGMRHGCADQSHRCAGR